MSDRRELVEHVFQAVNARNHAALGELLDPDFEFHSLFAALEGGSVFRGIRGLDELVAALDASWEELTLQLEAVRDIADTSVVLYRVTGTARASRVPLDERPAMVWTWRAGKVCKSETYTDRDQALEAAGLSE